MAVKVLHFLCHLRILLWPSEKRHTLVYLVYFCLYISKIEVSALVLFHLVSELSGSSCWMEYIWVFPLDLSIGTALGVWAMYATVSCKFCEFLHTDQRIIAEKRILGLQVCFFLVYRRKLP